MCRMAELRGIWETRWNYFHRSIHSVAHMLHPLFLSPTQIADKELEADWLSYIYRVGPRIGLDPIRLMEELAAFRFGMGTFGHEAAQDPARRQLPITWWTMFGSTYPSIQRLALRVLSQVCNSSNPPLVHFLDILAMHMC